MKKKIAVMSLCFTTLIYLVLSVSVAGLLDAFPDVPQSTVLLVLTLPNLTGIAGILLVPFLAPHCSQKALSVASLALLCVGGGMSLIFHASLSILLLASGLIGVAYGVISTLYPMLVNTNFSGEERITVMGLCAAMLQGGRLTASLIGGWLARVHWWAVFETFAFALAALVLVVLFLPRDRAPGRQGGARDTASLRSWRVWRLSLFSAAFACLYFLVSTETSVYVEGYGIGDASLTGLLSSVACAVAAISAALYGKISKFTGRFTLSAAFGLVGAGFLYTGRFIGVSGAAVAFITGALGISLFTPWLMTAISDAAGQTDVPVATAIVLTCVNLGYFVTPYVSVPLGALFGGGSAGAFTGTGIALLLLCGVTAFLCRKEPLA
jgi:hypothetical protein